MTEPQSERRLRAWFAAASSVPEPASLRRFLVALPDRYPRTTHRALNRPRLVVLAAAAVAVVVASALAVAGSHLLDRSPESSLPLESSNPSANGLDIGSAVRVGEHAGTRASFAQTSTGAVIAVSSPGADVAAGSSCPPSAIGSVGPTAVDWVAGPAAILELAGDGTAASPVGLGVSSDCSQAIVATPDGSGGFRIQTPQNLFARPAPFFALKPGDPSTVAAWVADPAKGGFISWSIDAGVSWQALTNARPIGWDDAGEFWTIGSDGSLARSPGPGFGSEQTGAVIDVGSNTGSLEADIAAAVAFGDRILVAPTGGGLESVVTSGATPAQRVLELRVSDLSATRSYVAAVGFDGAGSAELAISADGQHFVVTGLPSGFGASNRAAVRLFALADRVLVSDGGSEGVIGIWSVPVGGLPPAPPAPTPLATPTIPSPPPAKQTSTWTEVALPEVAPSPEVAGAGRISTIPGGGFIDFIRTATDRSAVFTSPDGRSWSRVGEVTGLGLANIDGPVAYDGTRYVALGGEGGGVLYGQQSNGAAWASTDLSHWRKAPVQDAFAGAELHSLTAGPNGFVAIGYDAGGTSVWTSRDGLAWTAIVDAQLFPPESAEPSDIVYTGGEYLILGRIGQAAAEWRSKDGRVWSLTSPLVPSSDTLPSGFAPGPAGYVTLAASGTSIEVTPGDFRAAVSPWISVDGTTWRPQASSPALFGASAAIVGAPGGYVASGTVGLDPDAHIWTSTDGISWVEVAGVDLRGVGSLELVSDGRHVLFLGSRDSGALLLVSNGVER
jgi:hypothetical protein